MRYYFLLVLLALASYFVAASISALTIHFSWPGFARAAASLAPRRRARTLLLLRALPSLCGLSIATIFTVTFLQYEPLETSERAGTLLIVAAAGAVWLVLGVSRQGARALRRTLTLARLSGYCRTSPAHRFPILRAVKLAPRRICVVDSSYPVAAVTGLFRTQLVVSERVLRECEPEELDAILAHEAAHVSRGDNLARALMLSLPDPLGLLPCGRAIESRWSAAAEEAADDDASAGVEEKRAALASALVRVAGMATTPAPDWMPALAFFRGTDLDRRVRRLLEPEPPALGPLVTFEAAVAAAALLFVAFSASQGPAIRGVMEWAIRTLP